MFEKDKFSFLGSDSIADSESISVGGGVIIERGYGLGEEQYFSRRRQPKPVEETPEELPLYIEPPDDIFLSTN